MCIMLLSSCSCLVMKGDCFVSNKNYRNCKRLCLPSILSLGVTPIPAWRAGMAWLFWLVLIAWTFPKSQFSDHSRRFPSNMLKKDHITKTVDVLPKKLQKAYSMCK